MPCHGVRGATTTDANTRDDILKATRELFALMVRLNGIREEDVACVIFSTTYDLDAEFPAQAARQLGWLSVAMMCDHELDVPGSLRHCIRVLVQWNTDLPKDEILHVYLKEAIALRPDLAPQVPPVDWGELEQWIQERLQEVKPSRR